MMEYANQQHRSGTIHFVGIGGVGMCGIAEVLHNLGYRVQGSDLHDGAALKHLRENGIEVFVGHRAEHIDGCQVAVVSSAVTADNPEVREARRRRIPVLKRAEMLAELMRFRFGVAVAGTHGKTTTTSLVAATLSEAGFDPTYVIGGRIKHRGGGAGLGRGRYLVVEADESDASFLHLNPIVAVITNIDNDHLGAYGGDFSSLEQAFQEFVLRLPFYGTAVVCYDDPALRAFSDSLARNFITYGFSEGSDIRAFDVRIEGMASTFRVDTPWWDEPSEFRINLPGEHNVLNALATLGVCHRLDVPKNTVEKAFAEFGGIVRRFQMHGEVGDGSGSIVVIDDYGHHPTEISATLETVRRVWSGRRLLLAFQPHRYSRTKALFDDFVTVLGAADVLVLFDIYPAGEVPLAGVDSHALSAAIGETAGIEVICVGALSQGAVAIAGVATAGDVVLTMGAGSIGTLAPAVLEELRCHDRH